MKKALIIIIVLGLLALASTILIPTAVGVYRMSKQMAAGRAVLDALTQSELDVWLARSEELWQKFEGRYDMGVYHHGIRPLPPDLAAMKIIRVDVYDDMVCYVWMGGMDHCLLIVEKRPDGHAYFTAVYSDDRRKELPKIKRNENEPNNAMEPTPVAVTNRASPRFARARFAPSTSAAHLGR